MDIQNGKECGSIDSLEFDGNTVLCRVCGDKASGFHYGVHACEGCKGFFRRSIQQKIQYRPCLKNQQCSIMRVNRNRCQYCRLKKCIAVGMSRDAVRFGRVPKREKAKIIEQMQKVNAQSQVSVLNSLLENENDVIQKIMDSHFRLCDFTHSKFVEFFEKAWAEPRFVDCPAHKACPLNPTPSEHDSMSQWDEFSNCFTPAIRNVVYFAKCIPGFSVFSQEDQVTLLKAGTFEVLLVHLAPLFDSRTNTMLFANGTLYKRSAHTTNSNAGFLLDSMFDFADHLNDLKLKDEEIGLFSALVIIASDRLGLRYADQVARLQSTISKGLQKLVQMNHPEDPTIFSRLLMKVPDLRTLNTLHSEKLLGLTIPSSEGAAAAAACAMNKPPSNHLHPSSSSSSSSASRCPYSNKDIKSEGAPIVPHHVAMETDQKEVILHTPFGTFHRDDPKPSHLVRSAPSSSSSPEPFEMDLPESKAMPTLSPMLKRPGDAIEKDPKLMRLWEYDMRSERSDSLSSNSSLESVDSAYRTISTPGTPRLGTESRSPVPTERSSSALNVPTLKTALSSPPLNLQLPSITSSSPSDPVCMMPPKFRIKQSLSGSSTPEAKHLKQQHSSPASTEASPRLPAAAAAMPPGSFPHPFMLYNQYAAAAAFHQHMMMMQQHQHPDLIEQQGLLPYSMNLSRQNPQATNLLQIKPEPL